jgi:hypothetical protein
MIGNKNDKCEWCDKTYPPAANELYYKSEVFGIEHVICGDCFDKLKEGVSVRLKLVEYVKRGHGRTNNHRGINQGRGTINNPTGKSNVTRDGQGRFISKGNCDVVVSGG